MEKSCVNYFSYFSPEGDIHFFFRSVFTNLQPDSYVRHINTLTDSFHLPKRP